MTYKFFRLYTDTTTFDVPGLLKVDASTISDAVEFVAKEYGWKVTSWDGNYAWYQSDGKDFQYTVNASQPDPADSPTSD